MFSKKEKIIEVILSIIVLLLIIVLMVLLSLINKKKPEKYLENKEPIKLYDYNKINFECLYSFDFTYDRTITEYSYYIGNLGYTDRFILDCFTGTCTEEIEHQEYYSYCNGDGSCGSEIRTWTEYNDVHVLSCSRECYNRKSTSCYCSLPYQSRGKFSRGSYGDY